MVLVGVGGEIDPPPTKLKSLKLPLRTVASRLISEQVSG